MTPLQYCLSYLPLDFLYFYSSAFCFLSVSYSDHCEILISREISARLLTSAYLKEVPRVKSLSVKEVACYCLKYKIVI